MLASRCILEILYKHKSLSASYEKPARTNQFDAGAAWENLALEATFRGIATDGMQGFDYEKARKDLDIPDNFDALAMIAIGKKDPRKHLPPLFKNMTGSGI